MNLGNQTGRLCPHDQEVSSVCIGHEHDPEILCERYEPNRGILGKKVYLGDWCCGRPMKGYRLVRSQRCKQCGRLEDRILLQQLAFCTCCGYHFDAGFYC